MLKLIPHIADGSWMIRQSVGTTPVILGKVRVRIIRGQGQGRGSESGLGQSVTGDPSVMCAYI
jgi:hypothetical protein